MILIGLSVVAAVFAAARRRRWQLAVWAAEAWSRVRPTVLAYLRGSPATFAYLVVLTVTTWVLLGSSHQVVDLLLREHSTSLHQLRIDPVRVLIRSAFWAPGYAFLAWVVLFAVVLAPAERWLGTRRWVIVFAAGHVLATLGMSWALWSAIRYGWAPRELQDTIDVGVSYGLAAVAAVFTFRLPGVWRWRWAAALITTALAALFISRTFTDAGHLLALAIGFACYPLTTGPDMAARASRPVWSPPPATEPATCRSSSRAAPQSGPGGLTGGSGRSPPAHRQGWAGRDLVSPFGVPTAKTARTAGCAPRTRGSRGIWPAVGSPPRRP